MFTCATPSSPPAPLASIPKTSSLMFPLCLRLQEAPGHPRHPHPPGVLCPGPHVAEGELAGAALRQGGAGLQRAVPAPQRRSVAATGAGWECWVLERLLWGFCLCMTLL